MTTIEQVRQKLWCDAYLQKSKEMHNYTSLEFADKAVAEFDERFNDKSANKSEKLKKRCVCGNTDPFNDMCLNCGSSLFEK